MGKQFRKIIQVQRGQEFMSCFVQDDVRKQGGKGPKETKRVECVGESVIQSSKNVEIVESVSKGDYNGSSGEWR